MLHGCPSIHEWYRDVPRSARLPTALGFSLLLIMGCGFGAWATMAPLASAVVASGSFVATGQNKQVQHLEGGIIREMLVREGDLVQANQSLLRLDDTGVKAKLRRLILRRYRLLAKSARLEAEINSYETLRAPQELANKGTDPVVASIIHAEATELTAWRTSLLLQEELLKKEIAGLQETLRGYESQVTANRARTALLDEEIKTKNSLLDLQLVRKSDLLALQRAQAGLAGELGEFLGRIGEAKERSARAEQQIVQLRATAIQKATEDLHATESELDDVQEQILAAKDVVERTEVRAPVRGVVVKLNQHTPGGVVGPGSVIMELLPTNDELIIEARVNPREITHVKEGQNALVRLSALNQRLTPMVEGKVIYVSADIVPDQNTRRASEPEVLTHDSFVVRIRLDERDLEEKIEGFRPTPGMPADIFIQTGQRTFFEYLMRPVVDSFSRAFREQ
jgi:HlyD family type I secretion membrane fusion protein